MPKVDHQGGSAPAVTDSSHVFTTISAISRSSSSCQTRLFCLQYTLLTSEPSCAPVRNKEVTPLLNSARLHHLSLKEVCLYAIDWLQKFSLPPASISFYGKPTNSGLGHVTDQWDNDKLDVSRGLKKCLQEHAWNRLLEKEACEAEVVGPAKTIVDLPTLSWSPESHEDQKNCPVNSDLWKITCLFKTTTFLPWFVI